MRQPRRHRRDRPRRPHGRFQNWHVTGDDQTVQAVSRHRRDEAVALARVSEVEARVRRGFVANIAAWLGGEQATDRHRIDAARALDVLQLRCSAFRDALGAMVQNERERTLQIQAIARAIPSMPPGERGIAMDIIGTMVKRGAISEQAITLLKGPESQG